ncbi:hypothetical protein GCM10010300_77260 [Streptomyces olivaceoviridis]|uniref:hypothetical protein n=1 Tax=Streptomyces olivaceoviridis TaxID=1921 RepID=UPI0016775C20|nr:hypothetical protein [Streptomyces olivaceoviridis]GGZ22074.1 hypothetical protein GCM10010300_77260 [Streptomyces olivaceoviridis]
MIEPTDPREPKPTIPPLHTIADSERQPPRVPWTAPPRPAPIRTRDDIPPGALAMMAVGGVLAVILVLSVGVPRLIDWYQHQDWAWATQWIATIADPVHAYLAAHTAGLPLSASSAFVIWLGVGAVSLVLAWVTGAFGARLTWTAHGICTAAMVFDASPAAGRPVATALAVLAWTIGSLFTLRGLSLRPLIHLHNHNHPPAR